MKKNWVDSLMHLPVLNLFEPFYLRHREVLLYLFFGGLSFFVSLASFYLLHDKAGINELVANVLAWILATTFAYLTNRYWVFDGSTSSTADLLKQIASFYLARVATLAIEELIIFLFISILSFPAMAVKTAAQIIVIILNYIFSKRFVFRGKRTP